MKKMLVSTIVVMGLLAACSNPYQDNMNAGTKAYQNGQYEQAATFFNNAVKEKPSSIEAKNALTTANDAYFKELTAAGKKALKDQNYTEAQKLLEKAYKLNATKDKKLISSLENAKAQLDKQKDLDEYMSWLEDVSKRADAVSTQWGKSTDKLAMGSVTKEEFKKELEALMPKSNEIKTRAQDESKKVTGELFEAHTQYADNLQTDHETLRKVIFQVSKPIKPNEEFDPLSIIEMGKPLAEIGDQYSTHIQALKEYALANGLTVNE